MENARTPQVREAVARRGHAVTLSQRWGSVRLFYGRLQPARRGDNCSVAGETRSSPLATSLRLWLRGTTAAVVVVLQY